MKIVCIADLQGQCESILPNMLPKGDMLLIAGDLASWGTIKELETVNKWLGTLPFEHKVIVAGNHDKEIRDVNGHKLFTNATYLQDELVEIEGIKIYGSPANEMNGYRYGIHNGFCQQDYLRQVGEQIPMGLDILLTHGCPYGTLDWSSSGRESTGSRDLADAVIRTRPRYHVFGHIHESAGKVKKDATTYVNAAIMNERNILFREDGSIMNQPIVINLKSKRN